MSPIELRLSEDQLFALGGKLTPLGLLSPMLPKTSQQEKMSRSRIISPTLISGSGDINPDILPALKILANPTAFVYLTYVGRIINIETSYYYPDPLGEGDPVSLVADGDTLNFDLPGVLVQVKEILRQYIGETLIRPLDYDFSLSLADAWVLFAVIDASRKQILETHLKHETPVSINLTRKEVNEAVRTESKSIQWLSPYYSHCLGLAQLSESDIKIGLENLAEQDLLVMDKDGIRPSQILEGIANEYLVTDGHFRLRSDVLNNGEQLTTDLRAVQGRSGAIMLWSYDQQSIDLRSLSPGEFMLAVHGLTSNPGIHFDIGSGTKDISGAPPAPPESL